MFRFLAVNLFLIFSRADGYGDLWPNGIVHYSVNAKDYDVHSQDVITSTFADMQKELCIKFFQSPMNRSAAPGDRTLYISNPDKMKNCPPATFNYSGSVVDMPIGYKCLNPPDIARITVAMLKSSIDKFGPVNSFDLLKAFHEEARGNASTLLSATDRNYINSHYYRECSLLDGRLAPPAPALRKGDATPFDSYYNLRLWPLGIVMYTLDPSVLNTELHVALRAAMHVIEAASCVVFKYWDMESEALAPRAMLIFSKEGNEVPELGYWNGNQTLSLSAMVEGAPGHSAHALATLLRVLGMPAMSNRYDRDNYVEINWKNIQNGKENLFERTPREAWPPRSRYSFESATHAPGNYYCTEVCRSGEYTVAPRHDHLWQIMRNMGHRTTLAAVDKEMLDLMYFKRCHKRTTGKEL